MLSSREPPLFLELLRVCCTLHARDLLVRRMSIEVLEELCLFPFAICALRWRPGIREERFVRRKLRIIVW